MTNQIICDLESRIIAIEQWVEKQKEGEKTLGEFLNRLETISTPIVRNPLALGDDAL